MVPCIINQPKTITKMCEINNQQKINPIPQIEFVAFIMLIEFLKVHEFKHENTWSESSIVLEAAVCVGKASLMRWGI